MTDAPGLVNDTVISQLHSYVAKASMEILFNLFSIFLNNEQHNLFIPLTNNYSHKTLKT